MAARREAPGAGPLTKFGLLMWKNLLQQWRHPGQTVAEILLPAITMSLILLLRWQIEPLIMPTTEFPPFSADTIQFSAQVLVGFRRNISIAYSPESEVLEDIIRSSAAKLLLRNYDDALEIIEELASEVNLPPSSVIPPELLPIVYEIVKRAVNVTAYRNSSALTSIYVREDYIREVVAAVQFDDSLLGATTLPTNMSYALRFPKKPRLNSFWSQGGASWRTDSVFPLFEVPGPRYPFSWTGGNDPGYVNELFTQLQHRISSEIITKLTGKDMDDFNVSLQRYPHPPYLQDSTINSLQLLLPSFIMLSFSYTAVNIVRAIVIEKELQLKETMKIMGLPTWSHWAAWFCKQFLFMIPVTALILVIIKVNWFTTSFGFNEYAVFTNTPWTILAFFILFYLTCTIFFCFMITGFFSKASTAALFTGVVWFLSYIPAFLMSVDLNMSAGTQVFTCLFINSAMSYGFQLLLTRESSGGLQWGEFLWSPSTDVGRFLFGHVLIMLAVDCVLFMLVALYMEQVLPGPYGTPKPWYFLLQKEFWLPSKEQAQMVIKESNDPTDLIKEKDPADHPIGMQIKNLTKVYPGNVAVNNLNLNVYDNQITVLLGHNGAGKSTTISMLTGNLKPTHGTVIVSGYDITKQLKQARSLIGLCPQHNVLFNELTVREHLLFFGRLKGFHGEELNQEIDSIIEKLELQDKRDYPAGGLSGGQKRRLSVGVALSGAAKVVLLDEPTSGMDPASRRALWDLLQREKQGRSMILTTHFMDEADILGDRVAIMAAGKLQCVGSPYFLKQHYGVGYTLVVVKQEGFNVAACTGFINRHIPGIHVKEDRGSEVTYELKNEQSNKFENMLKELESNKEIINYHNYGLVATTLEDVFMHVGSDVVPSDDETNTATDSSYDPAEPDIMKCELDSSTDQLDISRKDNTPKWWTHFKAVWLKLWLVWTRSWPILLLQVLVPIIQLNVNFGVLQYVMRFQDTIVNRELTLERGFTQTETFVTFNGTNETSYGRLAERSYEAMFNSANNPSMRLTVVDQPLLGDYYLWRTEEDSTTMAEVRNRLLIGATFSDDNATAWFSNFGYHDIAISLATLHRALLKASIPNAELKVYNYPLEVNYADTTNSLTLIALMSMQLSSAVGNSLGMVSAVFIMFYIKERTSRAKLLQRAAGIKPYVMWGSAAVFDWLWFCVICLSILVSCAAFDIIGLSTFVELGRLYVLLMVYGAASLPFVYVCSYLFQGPAVGFVSVFFLNAIFGSLAPQIVAALWQLESDGTRVVADWLDGVFQFLPLYSLVTAVRSLNQIGLVEWSCLQACDYIIAVTPNITECTMEAMCDSYNEQCCVKDGAYWDWSQPGTLRYIAVMLATGAVFWIILMVAEYRLLQKIFNRKRKPPPLDESQMDEDVILEAKHVNQMHKGQNEHTLVAKGLTKYYGKHLAVNQVSFTVGETECFGLLGVNGAGKTTTFKMLMGDESVSSGDAFVGGHSVKTNITKVYENIGYCPQFDAVFGELTGRETLRLFSMLRGLDKHHSTLQTEALSTSLGFKKHLDKRVYQYSGGNKRKLSTAIALLGKNRLIFVDEPTTGVDPAAKRQVWDALQRARREGRGVVLTSHSMEECEALCSRLTIMVNGQFKCLGTPQHLKNKFSQGFTLTIKMRVDETLQLQRASFTSFSRSEGPKTVAIKNYVDANFHYAKIMEEYQGMLTYYLPDRSVAWSEMFGIMERAKRELGVEDYSISQTTLEQIFLQFTKYQREQR